jgi:DNA polymerase-3 subunit gamma/tau
MTRQLAQHCELAQLTDASIKLNLPALHKHLLDTNQQSKLQAELERYYGRALRLSIEVAASVADTPAVRSDNAKRERKDRAVAAIEADPFVREVVDMFDATINQSSIKSLEP